jgi:hypothetical protein
MRLDLILALTALVVTGGRVESHRFATTSPPQGHRLPQVLKQKFPVLHYRECKGDHFFLLSEHKVTCDAIKEFMGQ